MAVRDGNEAMVQLLLAFEPDLTISCKRTKKTALHFACMQLRVDIARWLTQQGASLECTDRDGLTPADYLKRDREDSAKMLMEARGGYLSWKRRAPWIRLLYSSGIWSPSSSMELGNHSQKISHSAISKCLGTREMAVLICMFI